MFFKCWKVAHNNLDSDLDLPALHRYSYKKVFRKYGVNLQENNHVEMRFQQSYNATLLKSHFGMGVLLSFCRILLEKLFPRTPLEGCFWFLLESSPNFIFILCN